MPSRVCRYQVYGKRDPIRNWYGVFAYKEAGRMQYLAGINDIIKLMSSKENRIVADTGVLGQNQTLDTAHKSTEGREWGPPSLYVPTHARVEYVQEEGQSEQSDVLGTEYYLLSNYME